MLLRLKKPLLKRPGRTVILATGKYATIFSIDDRTKSICLWLVPNFNLFGWGWVFFGTESFIFQNWRTQFASFFCDNNRGRMHLSRRLFAILCIVYVEKVRMSYNNRSTILLCYLIAVCLSQRSRHSLPFFASSPFQSSSVHNWMPQRLSAALPRRVVLSATKQSLQPWLMFTLR